MLFYHTFHAEFFNDDSFIMKFIITDSHDLFSISIYIISSYFLFLWILFLQHDSHLVMYFTIWFLKSLMLHLYCMRFSILLTSKCLSVQLLWHFCINLSFIKEVFFTLYVVANSFVRISFSLDKILV